MAIITAIESRGIELKEAYIKIRDAYANVEIYASKEARESGVVFDTDTVKIEVNEAVYNEFKKAFPDCVDVLEEGQEKA